MNTPVVRILITVPDADRLPACTLALDTIRTGFPTAPVLVDINQHSACKEEVVQKALAAGASPHVLSRSVHHAEWIRTCIDSHHDTCPLVIVDGDVIFWKSVEEWGFDSLLAGYYVPRIWNDFARAVSFPRIHTSFMWFQDVPALRQAVATAYPYAQMKHGAYCPCEPFMPDVKFIEGQPYFWDSCAVLYNMLGDKRCTRLTPDHLDCFDHINSTSFYEVMCDRLQDSRGFRLAVNVMARCPETLKGLWTTVNSYYARKAIEADILLPGL
jgi:hypothetical protein